MTYLHAKENGVQIAAANGCELLEIKDGNVTRYWMHSPHTGDHSIVTLNPILHSVKDAERVNIHWRGFLADQP
jgi:hypothetical protein